MITPAYESFVNNICMDIANESISDKIKSGWDKVIKFWDSVIKFIQKKINEFISFIKNIFTKKKKLSEKDAEVKSSNSTNIDNFKKANVEADNNAVTNKFIDYGEYCKISGNLYLMCVNIDKIIFNLKYYISAIKKDPGEIYDFIEVLDEANNCVDNPEKYIRTSYFCTITGNDNNHLDEDWIIKRIKGIQDRKKLTDVWNSNGITEEVEYSILTNEIYKEWSGFTAKQYKQHKGLRKESLRDNMTDIEVALADLGEIATRELAKEHRPLGLEQNRKVAKMGGHAAKVARDDIEKNLGRSVVSKDNALSYKYVEDDLMIETKK